VSAPELPGWFAPLAEVPARARLEDVLRTAEARPDARRSAVLMLFGEGPQGPDVLLTQRAATLRSHAGQVSFPGGRLDPTDAGPAEAAVREAQEETAVDPSGVVVVGLLPELYLTPSQHLVTPVLAWWQRPSPVVAAEAEVARVARVPVSELVDPQNRFRVGHPSGYVGPGFAVRGLFVWGFTAMLLDRLLGLAGWELPWDESRLEPLPEVLSPVPEDSTLVAEGETGAGDVPAGGLPEGGAGQQPTAAGNGR
jgi:8-oxo-dGTP pyrophosphatase MutT (NUDIX family)